MGVTRVLDLDRRLTRLEAEVSSLSRHLGQHADELERQLGQMVLANRRRAEDFARLVEVRDQQRQEIEELRAQLRARDERISVLEAKLVEHRGGQTSQSRSPASAVQSPARPIAIQIAARASQGIGGLWRHRKLGSRPSTLAAKSHS